MTTVAPRLIKTLSKDNMSVLIADRCVRFIPNYSLCDFSSVVKTRMSLFIPDF